MRSFAWTAVDAEGARVNGRAQAQGELELDRELDRRGLVLVRAELVDRARETREEHVDARELAALTARFATLARAGVPLVQGLETLAERTDARGTRALCAGLARDLRAGATLGEALERRPATFSAAYRAAVRAGEASGALGRVLDGLSADLEAQAALRERARQALLQPAILCAALLGLVLLLVGFLLPRVAVLYGANTDALPAETRALLVMSSFLREQAVWIVAVLSIAALFAGRFGRDERAMLRVHTVLLAIPRLGRVLRAIATARFARTAAVLHGAGCDAITLLDVAGEASGNLAFRAAARRAGERLARGALFSEALQPERCVDGLLVQIVAVGEASGTLAPTLEEAARRYEADVPRELARFFAVFEPLLLVVSGIVVLWILLAALLPIFDLYERLA